MKRWAGGGQQGDLHMNKWAGGVIHRKKRAGEISQKILHMKGWEGMRPPYEEVGSFETPCEEVGRSNTFAMRTEITT